MEEKNIMTKTQRIKKVVMSRDSFQKLVKENESLNTNLGKLHDNYYDNMKTLFNSDEKKNQILMCIEKLRFKDKIKRSISPVLDNQDNLRLSSIINPYNKSQTNTLQIDKSQEIIQHQIQEKPNSSRNGINYNKSQTFINFNDNNISNQEKEKKLIKISKNKFNLIDTESMFKNTTSVHLINKKEKFQITFTRINITTFKKENHNILTKKISRNLMKDKFSFSIQPTIIKNYDNNNMKSNLNNNPLKIESNNLIIESNIEKNKIKQFGDFTGYKLIKLNNGKLQKEISFNESIESLNKQFEEEKIAINNIPLKFHYINFYSNEIDQIENFNILPLLKEKIKLNLINTGMNTIKEKKKFKDIGINVGYIPITSNAGNNTDINLLNWNKFYQINKNMGNNLFINESNTNRNIIEIKNEKNNNFKAFINKSEEKKIEDNLIDSFEQINLNYFDKS